MATVRGNDLKMEASFAPCDADWSRPQTTPTSSSPNTRGVADLEILVDVAVWRRTYRALQTHVTAVFTRARNARSICVRLATPVKLSPPGHSGFSSATSAPTISTDAPSVAVEGSKTPGSDPVIRDVVPLAQHRVDVIQGRTVQVVPTPSKYLVRTNNRSVRIPPTDQVL